MSSSFSDSEISEIRADFPHTEHGYIYLNHAAISPLSQNVKQAIEDWLQERHLPPIENMEKGMAIIEETRQYITEFIHAPSPDSISFTGNTSDGISAVAEGFAWQPGDQIILNTLEFPANIQPFRILERQGVEIVYVKPENGMITPEILEAAITPDTKMISVSAVQYLNGYKADLASIGKLCRDRDIFFVVDGIQALGAVPVDVEEAHIDALASGGHKWLMGPLGIGFLFLSGRLSRKLRPYKTGWLSVEDPWDLTNYNQKWQPLSQHLETGTPNLLGITGMGASLKRFSELGPGKISARIQQLSGYMVDTLSQNRQVQILTPKEEHLRAGIVTFSVDKQNDVEEAVQQLKKKNITISAREGYFRIAPHYYNTQQEIDRAIQALSERL